MEYEVIAILISPFIGVLTVCVEYIKDKKEKLQDRKAMWLNEHYKELYIEFENLANFSCTILINIEGKSVLPLRGYQILGTNLVEYQFGSGCIEVKIRLELNYVKKIYKNSVSHLHEGYKLVCKQIGELWNAENNYKDSLSVILNDILKRVLELMNGNFPNLNPSTGFINKCFNAYNIKKIIETLIESRMKNSEELAFNQKDGTIHPKSNITDIIAFLDALQYNKFKNNVWEPLNNEFKGKIDKLIKEFKELSDLEKEFTKSIENIIDDYKSGHAIEGYCDICDKIYHEKDITKLRPKV